MNLVLVDLIQTFALNAVKVKMTIKPVKRVPLTKRVVIERHDYGPLKGKAARWYWACAVCGLVYVSKGPANFCCGEHKGRHWFKLGMKPKLDAIGRVVDGEFTRFKK